jgi:hypothetical protein
MARRPRGCLPDSRVARDGCGRDGAGQHGHLSRRAARERLRGHRDEVVGTSRQFELVVTAPISVCRANDPTGVSLGLYGRRHRPRRAGMIGALDWTRRTCCDSAGHRANPRRRGRARSASRHARGQHQKDRKGTHHHSDATVRRSVPGPRTDRQL